MPVVALTIRGRWQGSLQLDLEQCTVRDLKVAIGNASDIPPASFKLLCAGKTLRDDTATLAAAGIRASSRIMMCREASAAEAAMVDAARAKANQREAVLTAAGRLAERTVSQPDSRYTQLQLTNQDGEVLAIPQKDSAALVRGMVLHSHARNVLQKASSELKRSTQSASSGGNAAAGAANGLNNQVQSSGGQGLKEARAEALQYLLEADTSFRSCSEEYRRHVDNHAHVCLDAAWLLFLTRDLSNLQQTSALLTCAAEGFARSHGQDLNRLRALKGDHCPEVALYARLHLLQGVVAYLAGANEFLEVRRQRLERVAEWLEAERQRKRFGRTANRDQYVNPTLVAQLVSGGVDENQAVRALRHSNNNLEGAVTFVMAPAAPRSAATGGAEETKDGSHMQPPSHGGHDSDSMETGSAAEDASSTGSSDEGDDELDDSPGDATDSALFQQLAEVAAGAENGQDDGDDEALFDTTLREESLAADMYLMICTGKVPLAFDMQRIRGVTCQAPPNST
ncbi:hypothetical protein JKP88DRAFT_267339 [Tribonema minus]|uniref:NEDD8 ultimate buster 1 n=1 Tax=Tribonema minus TaxID=303371 RepID=A0A835Z994_9STRA|nr:hypothetical protein JKP88DRAFT_267339 [Tribonema minus]